MSSPDFDNRYQETLDFLYHSLPMFQRDGAKAFKKDLGNTLRFAQELGNPEKKFKSIHVAGTNGKGSSAHLLASIYQHASYKTGLYTSPHLKTFTERIRINGEEIEPSFVVDFVDTYKPFIEELQPSFFEITVAMAFEYFAQEEVDIAIVEVGMGGRLDSTNILQPLASLITNIGMDHQQWLGDTLEKIAGEKAGIIKAETPVIVSETQPEIEHVFTRIAQSLAAPIHFADQTIALSEREGSWLFKGIKEYVVNRDEFPDYQAFNIRGVLAVVESLFSVLPVENTDVVRGIESVNITTGLKGRWQQIHENPRVICDVGHNEAGVNVLLRQISAQKYKHLYIVWGTVSDKEIGDVLQLLPQSASYVFCEAKVPRAMPAVKLAYTAGMYGLKGEIINDVNDAVTFCIKHADNDDLIIVGGSNFVVAELDQL